MCFLLCSPFHRLCADVDLPSMSLYVQAEQFQQVRHVSQYTIGSAASHEAECARWSCWVAAWQALMVKDTFDLSNRLQLLLPHRPKHRPTRGHTREWWKYAFFCVTKPKKSSGIIEVRTASFGYPGHDRLPCPSSLTSPMDVVPCLCMM